jgi:hypothetical protein
VCELSRALLKRALKWLQVQMTPVVDRQLALRPKLLRAKGALEIQLSRVHRQMNLQTARRMIKLVAILAPVDRVLAAVASLVIRQRHLRVKIPPAERAHERVFLGLLPSATGVRVLSVANQLVGMVEFLATTSDTANQPVCMLLILMLLDLLERRKVTGTAWTFVQQPTVFAMHPFMPLRHLLADVLFGAELALPLLALLRSPVSVGVVVVEGGDDDLVLAFKVIDADVLFVVDLGAELAFKFAVGGGV